VPVDSVRLPHVTHDAVVIVPGIMGSRLVETATGTVVWGLDPKVYVDAWLTGGPLRRMRLDEEERAGRYGRIRADQLIQAPSWFPVLRGVEPYTELVNAVRKVLADPAALKPFPYDWRLPVAYNAERLAEKAMDHLKGWRDTPAHKAAQRMHPTGRPARLVIVAHSMGGLLARRLTLVPGVAEEIRAVVTLGTPFHGSVKAVTMLSSGRGMSPPLPPDRTAELVAGMPGMYDLLPWYSCVDERDSVRYLDRSDIAGFGGDPELFDAAWTAYHQDKAATLPGHRLVVGTAQPTPQSIRVVAGTAEPRYEECWFRDGMVLRQNRWGDGTVSRGSAELPGSAPVYWAQQHAALARTSESIRYVLEVVRERDPNLLGPPLGAERGTGLDVPDTPVVAGQEWTATVTGVPHARAAKCFVVDGVTGRHVDKVPLVRRDDVHVVRIRLPRPGLFRIVVDGGGTSAVSQLVLAEHP